MNEIESAIAQVRDRSSILWAFYERERAADIAMIEVRLNGSKEQASSFRPPPGWNLHRSQWGDTFFIRRQQTLGEAQIEEMLCAMLRFANEHGMQVQSWDMGPDLAPDGFHP